jgi:hypothetical protein
MTRLLLTAASLVLAAGCTSPILFSNIGTPCAEDGDCVRDYVCEPAVRACVPIGVGGDGGLLEGGCVDNGEILTVSGDDISLLGCTGAITGTLILEDATSLSALEGLSEVDGDLIIRNSPNLTSLEGLGELFAVTGQLVI